MATHRNSVTNCPHMPGTQDFQWPNQECLGRLGGLATLQGSQEDGGGWGVLSENWPSALCLGATPPPEPKMAGASPPCGIDWPSPLGCRRECPGTRCPGSQEGPGRLVTCPEAPSSVSPACLSPLLGLALLGKDGFGPLPRRPRSSQHFSELQFPHNSGGEEGQDQGPGRFGG